MKTEKAVQIWSDFINCANFIKSPQTTSWVSLTTPRGEGKLQVSIPKSLLLKGGAPVRKLGRRIDFAAGEMCEANEVLEPHVGADIIRPPDIA